MFRIQTAKREKRKNEVMPKAQQMLTQILIFIFKMAKIIALSNQKGGVGKSGNPVVLIPVEHCNLHLYEV